jgi:hypothetical protein
MDETLLHSKGVHLENIKIAIVQGCALRLGQRATLIRNENSHVYGILMSVTHQEIDLLYSDASVQAYRPEAVIAQILEDQMVPALCFNLIEPPGEKESNREYAEKLQSLAVKKGFPKEYIDQIR